MQLKLIRENIWYKSLVWAGVLLCIFLIGQGIDNYKSIYTNDRGGDLVRYWTAWRINQLGYDPYNGENVHLLEDEFPEINHQYGFDQILHSPPWAITIMAPIVLFDFPDSRLVWFLLSIFLFFVCTVIIWRYYYGPTHLLWLAWVITFSFSPTIFLLRQGQITFLALFGLIGFLYWTERKPNDWLAGISLGIATIKPQLVFIIWIAVLFWIIKERRWKILLSSFLIIGSTTLITLFYNPKILHQYINLFIDDTNPLWYSPTIGTYLRALLGKDLLWLQIIPILLGILWIIFYWYRKKNIWKWENEVLIILWVAFFTSAYSWSYDQVLLLLPILATIIWLLKQRNVKIKLLLLIGSLIVINGIVIWLHTKHSDEFFIWLTPVLFLWFWLATQFRVHKFPFSERNSENVKYSNNPY